MFQRFSTMTIILILIAGLVGVAAASPVGVVKAQPALLEYAAAHPDSILRVIAVKSHPNSKLAELVRSFGGEVIHDLSMINAVAARLPSRSVRDLASSPGVRWVAMDGPVEEAGKPTPPPSNATPNTYLDTLRVREVWNMGLRGEGIGVAVIDSGIYKDRDFSTEIGKPFSRVVKSVNFYNESNTTTDLYGHGTHVAGIIGGNGGDSPNAMYAGIAPKVTLISLKVNDDVSGLCYESDVVKAMQWVYDNKTAYNIRVVNLSLNSTVESSYHNSPLNAAAEILWFNGVVVVASAGNYWSNNNINPIRAAPANDPFIITVGATDEKGSTKRTDDSWANFSAIGTTLDGYKKPEIHAPGKDIRSVLSDGSDWRFKYPDRVLLSNDYFRLSGTSMSAPMVSGVVALLLQDEPNLTPDQVKYRLINTASWLGPEKYLDAYAAVTGTTTQSANTGLTASQLLWSGSNPINWNSVSWNSVSWNSVSWNSVSWNSVSWNSVSWNSVYFGP